MINYTLKKNISREAVRYIIVGLANTAITAVVIFGLMAWESTLQTQQVMSLALFSVLL